MIEQETKRPVLVFVEYASHCAGAVSLLKSEKTSGPNLVALDPAAEYALEKMGQTYSTPDDYYSENELNELGIGNFSQAEQVCQYVDQWLGVRCELLKEYGLKPAWFSYVHLKILLDAATVRLLILSAILRKERPVEVWYFEPKRTERFDHHLFYEESESIYSCLIPLICWSWKIPVRKIVEPAEVHHQPVHTPDLSFQWRWLKPVYLLIASLPVIGASVGSWWSRLRKGSEDTLVVLDLGEGEVQLVVRELLQRSGYRLLWWKPGRNLAIGLSPLNLIRLRVNKRRNEQLQELGIKAEKLCEQLFQDKRFRDFLIWKGIDYFTVVESRLRYTFTDLVVKAAECYLQARELIATVEPKVILLSQVALYWQHAVRAAASAAAVPVVGCQHGAFGDRISPMVYYTECAELDYMLVYGKGVQQFLQRHYPRGAVPISVGSARLDCLSRQTNSWRRLTLLRRLTLDPTKKTVIYCPSAVYGNRMYISYNYPKSDSQYFKIQRRIVEIFRDFPSVQLIIKEHPGTPRQFPLQEFVRDRQITNCLILKEGISLSELLPLADLFVLDFPTTTFLEMLTTDKPVLVFNNWYCWDEGALELLKQAAIFNDDIERFSKILREYLTSGFSVDAKRAGSKEFLRLFGTHLGDGRSAERSVAAIKDMIQRPDQKLALLK